MKGCLSKVSEFIQYISVGKYRTPLYYKNKDHYSTVFSGTVTFICLSILLVYTVLDFKAIFDKDHINFDVSGEPILHSKVEEISYDFLTNCAKSNFNKCVKYNNLDHIDTFIAKIQIDVLVY